MDESLMSASGSELPDSEIRPSRVRSALYDSSSRRETSSLLTLRPAPIPGLEEIIGLLRSSHLPGPTVILGPLRHIDTGGQFIVQKAQLFNGAIGNYDVYDVAIKTPKFDIDLSKPLQLTDHSAQEHLKSIATEVKALTTLTLRRHPNIVQLLSWSYDSYSLHGQPMLVMELASSNLHKLLQKKREEISYQQRGAFCSDIASGLDAIHDCGFVHGDLKPANILVFAKEGNLLAKLADFGLSIVDLEGSPTSTQLTGTKGWQAPEVEDSQVLPHQRMKADSYSFGLMMWSILFCYGERVPGSNASERRDHIMRELENTNAKKNLEPSLTEVLQVNLPLLLHDDTSRRPNKLSGLFGTNKEVGFVKSKDQHPGITVLHQEDKDGNVASHSQHVNPKKRELMMPQPPWELHPLNPIMHNLIPRFMHDPTSAPRGILFAYFLELTMIEKRSKFPSKLGFSLLDVLLVAANLGIPTAQAVIPDIFAFCGKLIPEQIEGHLTEYLQNAVSTGSTFARGHLESRDNAALQSSRRCFEANGGYGRFYTIGGYNHQIHPIVSNGHVDDLRNHLNQVDVTGINHKTIHGEPPLYLACVRGSWDIVAELLDRGAIAPENYTACHITCLHWAFAFDPSIQDTAVTRLVQSGLDIDAKASHPLPFFHYPFELPAGAPLHWAVATGSHTAIRALIEQGASLNIRDGSDPYRYDHRVRVLGAVGSLNEDAFSFSEVGTQGLSPLDYAAMRHDPFIFETLLSLKKNVSINDVDEEGFTVLHRLSTNFWQRTRSGVRFHLLPFQGDPVESMTRLERTVEAIKRLGGNFEQLTTPNINKAQAQLLNGEELDSEDNTPLMLAARGGCPDVVRVLLSAGADANQQNEAGITALHCIPENRNLAEEIASLLVSGGAEINRRGRDGDTPLQKAASACSPEMMDVLLSHGADIEEVDTYKRSRLSGSSIFAHLSRGPFPGGPFDETYDTAIASLFEKHILTQADTEKRLRIVAQCAPRSATLLDIFASCLMRHTVSVLIRCGSDVNAISNAYHMREKEKRMFKVMTRATPLDTAMKAKASYQHLMKERRHRTRTEYDQGCMLADMVIKSIQDAGGACFREPEMYISIPPSLLELKGAEFREALGNL